MKHEFTLYMHNTAYFVIILHGVMIKGVSIDVRCNNECMVLSKFVVISVKHVVLLI